MTTHISEQFSTRLIDWTPFVIMGNPMPPRDPDEDEEDGSALDLAQHRTCRTVKSVFGNTRTCHLAGYRAGL
jgi:hypothetical protein